MAYLRGLLLAVIALSVRAELSDPPCLMGVRRIEEGVDKNNFSPCKDFWMPPLIGSKKEHCDDICKESDDCAGALWSPKGGCMIWSHKKTVAAGCACPGETFGEQCSTDNPCTYFEKKCACANPGPSDAPAHKVTMDSCTKDRYTALHDNCRFFVGP